jgi:DNA helicase IV
VIAPSLTEPTSIRRASGDLTITSAHDAVDAAVAATRSALAQEGSIGVIVADEAAVRLSAALTDGGVEHSMLGSDGDIEARVDVVPATLAKGLEFDHVVLVEPSAIAAAEPDEVTGLRRLYVCLTRAVTSLVIVHETALPPLLRRPAS